MRHKRSIPKTIAIATVFALVAAPTLLVAVWEMMHNRGAGTYINVYGLAIHWTSALISVVALAATLLVALIARLVILWRDKRNAKRLITQIAARVVSNNDN
jgi:hypothetical protein